MESLWNPPAEPEQSLEGWVLADKMDTRLAVVGIGAFSLLFIGVGVAIVIGAGSWFGLLFAGFGLIFGLTLTRQARVVTRWKPGRLAFSNWPLELGGSYNARFLRQARRGQIGMMENLEARLELAEVVRYTVGTDTKTDKEVVMSIPLEISGGAYGDRIEGTIDVEIPADGPPSLDLNHNKVEWWVIVDIDMTDAIDDDSRFKLAVEASRR